MSDYLPLLHYKRDGISEVEIFGSVFVWSENRVQFSYGEDALIYGRSLVKPYQMKPIARDLDDLSLAARALSTSSHMAEPFHLRALRELSTGKATLLPESFPLGRSIGTKSQDNHPCAGKHSAIIRASAKNGWPTDSYLSQSHPYHIAFIATLRLVLGASWQPVRVAFDGCGLPTPTFRLSELAHLYEALAARKSDDWIWEAMTEHPEIIGGTERLDTAIMRANPGRVVAKEGADGLLGLSFENQGHAVGVVVKLSHGHDPIAAGFVVAPFLLKYGLNVPDMKAPHGQVVETLITP